MSFSWHPNEAPPNVEPHSSAKLEVFRQYLAEYINTLSSHHGREEFRLDLVDGFCGGGLYRSGSELIPGSPLVMLEEVTSARQRINANRRKSLQFDVKYYFIDKEQAHIDYLTHVLQERDYDLRENNISTITGRFEDHVDTVLSEIKKRQPIAGRSIFLLDQTGFSQVNLLTIKRIFDELTASEVILTIAMDALANYANLSEAFIKAVAPLHLTREQIQHIREGRDITSDGARQRLFRSHLRNITMASYDTPFYIKPIQSRRALWFVHLSKHPTARDVMIRVHWNNQNTFQHVGPGGFGMLGWDTLFNPEQELLFDFDAEARANLNDDLLRQLPNKLHGLVSHGPMSISELHSILANETAAQFSHLDGVIAQFVREGEFDLLTPKGRRRTSRRIQILQPHDQIAVASNPLLSIFLRDRQSN